MKEILLKFFALKTAFKINSSVRKNIIPGEPESPGVKVRIWYLTESSDNLGENGATGFTGIFFSNSN